MREDEETDQHEHHPLKHPQWVTDQHDRGSYLHHDDGDIEHSRSH
jgi:hypothetical protein